MKSVSLVVLFSLQSLAGVASAQVIQSIPLAPGQILIQQLADGRLVQFSCAAQGQTSVARPAECTATITLTLPGYIGNRPTQDLKFTGDSEISKLDAITKMKAQCKAQLFGLKNQLMMQESNIVQVCEGLTLGKEIVCKDL